MRLALVVVAAIVALLALWWALSGRDDAPEDAVPRTARDDDDEAVATRLRARARADRQDVSDDTASPDSAAGEPDDASEREFLVVDAALAPVADAVIALRADDATRRVELRTDHGGSARARASTDDWFVVTKSGYAHYEDSVEESEVVVRIRLERGYRIAGTVVDSSGRPICGANVHGDDSSRTTTTKDDGTFLLEDEPLDDDGTYVHAVAPGYMWAEEDVWPGDEAVVVRLFREAWVEGSVAFADGRPAVGAQVSGSVADDAGRWRTGPHHPGPEELRAYLPDGEHAGWFGGARVDLDEGQTVSGVDIVLEHRGPGFLRLRYVDAEQHPIAGATLWAGPMGSGETDALGRLTLAGAVNPGEVVGAGPGPGFPASQRKLPVSETPDGPEHILVRSASVRVEVVVLAEDGSALPAHEVPQVQLVNVEGVPAGPHAWTIPPGRAFLVHVHGASREERWLSQPAPLGDARIEVRVARGGTARGRLVLPGGRVAGDVQLDLGVRPSDGGSLVWRGIDADEIDELGRFAATGLPSGRVEVRVFGQRDDDPDVPLALASGVVAAGREVDLGDLEVRGFRRVRGTVSEAGGRPLGGVRVRFEHGRELVWGWAGALAATSSDGMFEIAVPERVPGVLTFAKQGWARCQVPLHDAAEPAQVRMAPASGEVVVRFTRASPWEAWPRFELQGDGDPWPWVPDQQVAADGRIVLRDLPEGSFRLFTDGGSASVEVRTVRGQRVDIDAPPAR